MKVMNIWHGERRFFQNFVKVKRKNIQKLKIMSEKLSTFGLINSITCNLIYSHSQIFTFLSQF